MKKRKHDDGLFTRHQVVAETHEEMEQAVLALVERMKTAPQTWLADVKTDVDILAPDAKTKPDLATLRQIRIDIANFESAPCPIYAAFQIGMRFKELQIRLRSDHVRRGRKTLQAVKDAHVVVHGTVEEKNARWAGYQSEYDTLRGRNPFLSREKICQQVAENCGVCLKTIKRHTQDK